MGACSPAAYAGPTTSPNISWRHDPQTFFGAHPGSIRFASTSRNSGEDGRAARTVPSTTLRFTAYRCAGMRHEPMYSIPIARRTVRPVGPGSTPRERRCDVCLHRRTTGVSISRSDHASHRTFVAIPGSLTAANTRTGTTFTAELERSTAIEPQRLANAVFATSPELVNLTSYARLIRTCTVVPAQTCRRDSRRRCRPRRPGPSGRSRSDPHPTRRNRTIDLDGRQPPNGSLTLTPPEMFNWPFSRMDTWTGGGLRRKQIVLIGGWTSNGRSVLYDQILEGLAAKASPSTPTSTKCPSRNEWTGRSHACPGSVLRYTAAASNRTTRS